MWRQRGLVVRARSWVQILFWRLADVVHDSPKFNFSSTLVNGQLVCLQPVGILNLVLFIICMFIYHCLFTLDLKSPNGEWPITYTYLGCIPFSKYNPIFVSPFHLSESEIRFESKESTSNSGFFGFNFNPDSDSPFLYPFHRAHAQCSLGIHHGVQRIELHRYVFCCCLSLFSNEYFCGIEWNWS